MTNSGLDSAAGKVTRTTLFGRVPMHVQREELGGADLAPLPPRPSTAEYAAATLRLQIAQGRLAPGQRLGEERIAAALGISRNTVREAFRLLAHERLVEHSPRRGVSVRSVSADDIRAVYVVRRLVEPLGIQAVLTDESARRSLQDVVAHAEAAADEGDWDTVGTADIDFHRILVAACGSTHLSAMFEQVLAELRLAFLGLPDRPALHAPFLERNRRLVDLVVRGDREAALAELGNYLDDAERMLLAAAGPPGAASPA